MTLEESVAKMTLKQEDEESQCEEQEDQELHSEEQNPSYYHFDLRTNSDVDTKGKQLRLSKLAYRLNAYMLENGCYDPRKYRQFPAPMDEDAEGNPIRWTLARRREVLQVTSTHYYELWRVPSTFEIQGLLTYLDNYGWDGCSVHILQITNNEDTLILHPSGEN
jgi:hypothetical protein